MHHFYMRPPFQGKVEPLELGVIGPIGLAMGNF